jgi:hypothetical protein
MIPRNCKQAEYVCAQCGTTFIRKASHKYKYCSTTCYRAPGRRRGPYKPYKGPLVSYTCTHCGHSFDRYPGREYKFCSRNCYYAAERGRKNNAQLAVTGSCGWCGAAFIRKKCAGSRTSYCSRSCQAYAAAGKSEPKILSPTDAAYLAAIIDGEGSVALKDRRATRPGASRPSVSLSVSNTYLPLMEWIKKKTAVGHVSKQRSNELGKKQCYVWRVASRSAVLVLQQVIPYMLEKKQRAIAAVESQPAQVFVKSSLARKATGSLPQVPGQQLSML